MKKTMILLHGLFGQLSNWETVIDHFLHTHDIHVPELPIYEKDPGDDKLIQLTRFVEQYITERDLHDITVVGNSLGGHVAILYAYRNPGNIEHLVLTGSSGLYENTSLGGFPRRSSLDYIRERVEYTFYDPATATSELIAEVLEVTSDPVKCLSVIRMAKSTQRNYVADLLPLITTPSLLIWGREDRITPAYVAGQFQDMLPNASLVLFDRCGHVPMMEKPEMFNEVLASFISKIPQIV